MSEQLPLLEAKHQAEILRRRTFAIISHPDAGKTTMTEKLLLYGGAIHLAGTVKGRKAARHATSDWMEIEKQRGISVSSSVLQFQYRNFCVNILDTPGHQDFSEDTYRTLCAADAAVMMIDGARGVQEQTIKLFQVCRLRGIPIFTFVNKMDRASRSPFELMDELEKVLGIFAVPFNWPIGTDGDFQGVYNRLEDRFELVDADALGDHGATKVESKNYAADDPALAQALGSYYREKIAQDLELLDLAGDSFDPEKFAKGLQTPLFFGSALSNFGVDFFLNEFLRLSPPPAPRRSQGEAVNPLQRDFSAFVFKIQANMNKDHHDRMAFIRICSGRFEKDMEVTNARTGKKVKLAQPAQFMAQDRAIIQEAYAGDILGLFDSGQFLLGDCLYQGKALQYDGIPIFPPEHFARVSAKDSMKRKQFQKGIRQLAEEGAIQIYRQPDIGTETYVIGVVGELQFEVLEFRLKTEYQVEIRQQRLPYRLARWAMHQDGRPYTADEDLIQSSNSLKVLDDEDRAVLLFESEWASTWVMDRNKDLSLKSIQEHHEIQA